jgi:hypothetical protein
MDGTFRGGRWTRAGQGDCEIWSLSLGDLVRAHVTRNVGAPATWRAALNAAKLGSHPTREAAMLLLEDRVIGDMRAAIGDWVKFAPRYSQRAK